MLEWMLGLLIVAALIFKVLEFLGLIDLSDVVAGIVKLAVRLVFAAGQFFFSLVIGRSREKHSG
jgi:hypothetical protein